MQPFLKNFSDEFSLEFDEQDRLADLITRHPGVNWKDALGYSQYKSKLALVEKLSDMETKDSWLIVIGGWVGLIPYLMNVKNIQCKGVINIEIDQVALAASEALNFETRFEYVCVYEDALNVTYHKWPSPIVINTSCEHLEGYTDWISLIPSGTSCILQSNNMFGLEEHVNCHTDLQEFATNCGLTQIRSCEEIDIGDSWKRFMIIGMR